MTYFEADDGKHMIVLGEMGISIWERAEKDDFIKGYEQTASISLTAKDHETLKAWAHSGSRTRRRRP